MDEDRLLPTPNAGNLNDGQTVESWRARKARERTKKYNGNGGATPIAMAIPLIAEGIDPADERSSRSSPGSEGSTSPPSDSGSSAPLRSSGTPRVPESSNDGGRLFDVGEMSPGSPAKPSWIDGREHVARGVMPPEASSISSSEASRERANPSPPLDGAAPDTTNAGYGRSSPVSLASYDPERSSSRTSEVSYRLVTWTLPQVSLFGDLPSERFSGTWPTSGTTRRGRAFELPMSARVTDASGFSSLLHTPTTGDTRPSYDPRFSPGSRREHPVPNLAAQIEDELLPTPGAWLGRRPENSEPDPERAASRNHEGIRGKRSTELPEVLGSLGEPTPPPSDDGSEPAADQLPGLSMDEDA